MQNKWLWAIKQNNFAPDKIAPSHRRRQTDERRHLSFVHPQLCSGVVFLFFCNIICDLNTFSTKNGIT